MGSEVGAVEFPLIFEGARAGGGDGESEVLAGDGGGGRQEFGDDGFA